MPDVLDRDLNDQALEVLEVRAQACGRSLQTELKPTLEQAAWAADVESTWALADRIRGELDGCPLGNSAELVAEDRAR
jgi:plasmid stability protein